MNINKRAKNGIYPKLEIGDNVRVPVIHKFKKDIRIALAWKYIN